MDAQVAFVVPPDHFRHGRPIPNSQHVRQVEGIARLLDAPILCQPVAGALNVLSDSKPCWDWPETPIRTAYIGHGVSDKGNYLSVNTDFTLVPSEFMARRSGPEARIMGMPILDPLFDGTLTPKPAGERTRVLYAPTISRLTNGQPMPSSRESAPQIVAQLAGFDVALSDHPHHTGAGYTPLQAYLDADVIVSDYGSTLAIAVALGKPVVIAPNSGRTKRHSLERWLGARVKVATFESLSADVATAAQGPTAAQQAARDTVLAPEHRGVSTKLAADVIASLA